MPTKSTSTRRRCGLPPWARTTTVLLAVAVVVDGWCLLLPTHKTSCSLRPAFSHPNVQHHSTTSTTQLWSTRDRRRRRPNSYEYYDDDEEDYIDDDDEERPTSSSRREDPSSTSTPYYYEEDLYEDDDEEDDYYTDNDDTEEEDTTNYVTAPPRVEWEEVLVPPRKNTNKRNRNRDEDYNDNTGKPSKVFVLLPPSPPTMHPLPSAVLHFVGGTWFGSVPQTFYRQLLEDIVIHTQCAIIVTPLPVITPLGPTVGPLQHVDMALSLKHQFQYAHQFVLQDEYGVEEMESVPMAGLGHSLGSRLLVVLATLMKDTDTAINKSFPYHYKSMILISFTNFAAAAGIPGISTLNRERSKLDRKQQQQQQQQQRPDRPRQRRNPYDDDGYDDIEEDLEWSELWSELTGALQEGADRIKTQWTPQAHDLEFYPTPRQLWRALGENDGEDASSTSRYHIPQTLLVQFDQDGMDQSAKLATVLLKKNKEQSMINTNTTNTTDLKFARLRGTHLTPITMMSSSSGQQQSPNSINKEQLQQQGLLKAFSSKSTQTIWNAIQGKVIGGNQDGTDMSQQEALRDLRQSITRYITDVVTK